MAEYIVLQIEQYKLKYKDVINKYPHLKEEIDSILRSHNRYDELAR